MAYPSSLQKASHQNHANSIPKPLSPCQTSKLSSRILLIDLPNTMWSFWAGDYFPRRWRRGQVVGLGRGKREGVGILIKNINQQFNNYNTLMVKLSLKGAQDPTDSSLQMKIRQYLVLGRKVPTEQDASPKVYAIRLFARNKVIAKSKFWYHLRRQLKTKSAQGQILAVNEIFERRPSHVKTFGIVLRYESRTGNHNMYKEFRDVSLNGAVSQLHAEMAGNHRASPDTISIIRTAVLNKKEEIRRPKSIQFRDSKLKFPVLRTVYRPSQRRYRNIFRASRPNTFRQ